MILNYDDLNESYRAVLYRGLFIMLYILNIKKFYLPESVDESLIKRSVSVTIRMQFLGVVLFVTL